MQDRLLCRAKSSNKGCTEWIEGFNFFVGNQTEYGLTEKTTGQILYSYNIVADTLCQSTTRRIGNRFVFENDILKVTFVNGVIEVIFLVFWSEERLRWELKYITGHQFFDEGLWALSWLFALVEDHKTIEIIGNTIDNPELMEECGYE